MAFVTSHDVTLSTQPAPKCLNTSFGMRTNNFVDANYVPDKLNVVESSSVYCANVRIFVVDLISQVYGVHRARRPAFCEEMSGSSVDCITWRRKLHVLNVYSNTFQCNVVITDGSLEFAKHFCARVAMAYLERTVMRMCSCIAMVTWKEL